jgi:hypothetical protein
VQVDRNTGQGFEKAFLNLPITRGLKLQTKHDGRAEVEFEDGSTLRVTPDTLITFPQLSLRDSGAKVSAVHLQEGTAYVKFRWCQRRRVHSDVCSSETLARAFGSSSD